MVSAMDAPLSSRFGRVVVTYVLEQPSEVRAVMAAAIERGAQVLKPAKKALFGSFSGSFRAPDGLVWKLASDKGRNTAEASTEPRPTEVTFILGVREPKESRGFYMGLGMKVDRDYGSKYIDFAPVTMSRWSNSGTSEDEVIADFWLPRASATQFLLM